MKVAVYSLRGRKDVLLGTISHENGKITTFPPNLLVLESMARTPFYDYSMDVVVHPEDGDGFLKAMPMQYSSGYLRVEVKNGPQSPSPSPVNRLPTKKELAVPEEIQLNAEEWEALDSSWDNQATQKSAPKEKEDSLRNRLVSSMLAALAPGKAADGKSEELSPKEKAISKSKDGFHQPENYDKIKDLPGGRELWAGANDWEAGWTWAWIQDKGQRVGYKHETPSVWVEVDHSECPGCGGRDAERESGFTSEEDKKCQEYAKRWVMAWADQQTKLGK